MIFFIMLLMTKEEVKELLSYLELQALLREVQSLLNFRQLFLNIFLAQDFPFISNDTYIM